MQLEIAECRHYEVPEIVALLACLGTHALVIRDLSTLEVRENLDLAIVPLSALITRPGSRYAEPAISPRPSNE